MRIYMNKFNANLHRRRHVYRFSSQKNNCAMKVESFLEYVWACIFECDPLIIRYACQSESMHSFYDGAERRYTPDFLVEYADGRSEFVEVHPSSKLTDEYRKRINHFSEYGLKEASLGVRIVTDEGLSTMVRTNYELIAHSMVPGSYAGSAITSLPQETTFGQLIDIMSDACSTPIESSYTLIGTGFYTFDMEQLLNVNTHLTRAYSC